MLLKKEANKSIVEAINKGKNSDISKEMIINLTRELLNENEQKERREIQFTRALKESLYNVYVKKDNTYVIYNTLYGGLIELSLDEYEGIRNVSSHSFSDEEMAVLVDNGLLIDSIIDEPKIYNLIRKKVSEYCGESQQKNYTIAVTTACNARCSYCYEKGIENRSMNIETAENIVDYICYNTNSGQPIQITWFGGEPLLNKDIITFICEKLQSKKVLYKSSIITNGLLLLPDVIEDAVHKWKTEKVQITLDGVDDKYNTIKNYVGTYANPFDVVISNIDTLIERDVYVAIRINIAKNNYLEAIDTVRYLADRYPFSEKILVYPAFVSLDNNVDGFSERDRMQIIFDFIEAMPFFSKIWCREKIYSLPEVNACMRDEKNSVFIDSDGSMCRCEHLAGKNKHYDVQHISYVEEICIDYNYDRKCDSCAFFPKCLGGCMEERKQNGNHCSIDKYIIEAILKDFV